MKKQRLSSLKQIFGSLLLLIAVIAAVSLVVPVTAGAQDDRSFYFPSVIIEAELKPDGSMDVAEQRTFRYDGRFYGAWQYIYLTGNSWVENVLVSEGGKAYSVVPVGTEGIEDTFFVDYRPDQVYIDWSYDAQNEDRTFTITYTVQNAVLLHQDVAELYWQFIGDQSGERTAYAKVTVTLPEGAGLEGVKAWAHGPLYGEIFFTEPNKVVFEIEDLPSRTFLECRIAFSPEYVPLSVNQSGQEGLPVILAEEEKLARQANLKRTMTTVDFFLAPALFLMMLLYLIVFRYRAKRSAAAYKGSYYRELPGDYSPAEAGYIYRLGKTGPEDFTATVLDLVHRGHVSMEEYQGERGLIIKRKFTDYRIIPGNPKDLLKPHEQKLFSFIFKQVGRNNPQGTTFRDISAYGKKSRESTAIFYKGWIESIKAEIEKQKFFKGAFWPGIIIAGIAITLLGVLCFFIEMYITAVVAIIFGPFLSIFIGVTKRLTPNGADHYAKWKAFRRFLLHFSRLDRSTIPSMAVWEHYLVYAAVLGVAKQVMQQLNLVYPELKHDTRLFSPTLGALAANPAKFDSLSSTMSGSFRTAFRSSSSSGSGGGGGFSGGGGGGGGGGGVGAR